MSRGRKTCCEGRCMWNVMILLLILALAVSMTGPSVLFTTTWHQPHHLESAQFQHPQAQQFNTQTSWRIKGSGIRAGTSMSGECGHQTAKERFKELVSRFTEIFQKGVRGLTAQRSVPLTSEVRPQTSRYLEKKAMCEQIECLPKSLKNVRMCERVSETKHVQDTCFVWWRRRP